MKYKEHLQTVVIPDYCKVAIFAGGKFRENVDKTFHMGVIFTIRLIFSS